jgi:hypothetical protein
MVIFCCCYKLGYIFFIRKFKTNLVLYFVQLYFCFQVQTWLQQGKHYSFLLYYKLFYDKMNLFKIILNSLFLNTEIVVS